MKTLRTSLALSLFAISAVAGCGLENSVVGGRCRDGMVLSGDTCVTPEPGITLVTPTDPIPMPSSSASGNVASAMPPPVPVPTPAPTFVEPPKFPPVVVTPTPLVCTPPLVACRGKCISVTSDPANCGACGKVCPSNICVDGLCQGAMPGDVVLIGHDYTNANPGSAQSKVLVNALSIPTTDPIRVLSYEIGAPSATVAQTKAVSIAGILGRSVSFDRALSASDLTSATLGRNYDIVLIHDASAGDAAAIGASWSTSLGDFTTKGGVVVALDRGTSPMPALLTSSGLLAVASHTVLPDGTHLAVTAAADVVGAQVLSPYAAFGGPISFQGAPAPSNDLDWVVRSKDAFDVLGDPVVIHRIVR